MAGNRNKRYITVCYCTVEHLKRLPGVGVHSIHRYIVDQYKQTRKHIRIL